MLSAIQQPWELAHRSFVLSTPPVCCLQFYEERMDKGDPAKEQRGQVEEFSFCLVLQPMDCVSSRGPQTISSHALSSWRKATTNHSEQESRLYKSKFCCRLPLLRNKFDI